MALFDVSDSNIAQWKLTTGALTTDTGGDSNSLTLTNNGTVPNVNGFTGGTNTAASFSGANTQYLSHADDAVFGGMAAITISVHVRLTSIAADSFIVSKAGSSTTTSFELIYSFGAEVMYASLSSNGSTRIYATSTTTIVVDTWYLVTVVYNGTDVRIYIDGVREGVINTLSGTVYDSTSELRIGRRAYGTTGVCTGYIDDVAIWDRALSAAEVLELDELGENFAVPLTDSDTVDLKVIAASSYTQMLDIKQRVGVATMSPLDSMVVISSNKTEYLDVKVTLPPTDFLDVKVECALTFNVSGPLDAKVIIADSTSDSMDVKVVIADSDTDVLDFTVTTAASGLFYLDIKSIISTAVDDLLDIKLTVGNTNLIIIQRSIGGFAASASIQWRIWNTDTQTIITDWNTDGVKEFGLGGGLSDYMVNIVHTTGETQLLLQWNQVGTNKFSREFINLQDLFAIESIKHLEAKTITDPDTGVQTKYERDGTTVYKQANLYEDSDGLSSYDENSTEINRRERFE